MTDPKRLLADGSSDFERALLRSWESEQPTAAARAKTAAIAGLGAATIAAAIQSEGGASLAPKAAAVGGSAIAKWAALCALVVAAGGAIAYLQHDPKRPVPRTPVAASPVAAVAPPEPSPAPISSAASAAASDPSIAVLPPAPPERPASEPHAASHASAPHAASTLRDQVTSIDRARRALADGDPRGALRLVDDYEARFPRGMLAEEAEVVRVEALVAAGDDAAADVAATHFLAAHPASPHASHVRSLVGKP